MGAVGGDWGYAGHNIAFGVREHAMGAAVNGMAAHGGVLPFGATFLVFSDYMKPSIRLSALSRLQVVLGVHPRQHRRGRGWPDSRARGTTRRPARDSVPDCDSSRRCNGNGGSVGIRGAAMTVRRCSPCSRQNVPHLDRSNAKEGDVARRARTFLSEAEGGSPEVILIGSGSEVQLCMSGAGEAEELWRECACGQHAFDESF